MHIITRKLVREISPKRYSTRSLHTKLYDIIYVTSNPPLSERNKYKIGNKLESLPDSITYFSHHLPRDSYATTYEALNRSLWRHRLQEIGWFQIDLAHLISITMKNIPRKYEIESVLSCYFEEDTSCSVLYSQVSSLFISQEEFISMLMEKGYDVVRPPGKEAYLRGYRLKTGILSHRQDIFE